MVVVQEAFDVPTDIMAKLATGEYRRIGGVVRYASGVRNGQIVKLLKPVDSKTTKQVQSVGAQIMNYAKRNKPVLYVGGAILGVITVGGIVYYKVKNHESAAVVKSKNALQAYLDEIHVGNLDIQTIENLITALDDLKSHKDYDTYKIGISVEDMDLLIEKIHDYTINLANNNQIALTEQECHRTDDFITNLQNYSKIQKRIFEKVA